MRALLGGVVALAAVNAFAQAAFQETRVSFGEVEKGRRIERTFVFRNAGSTELRVKAVVPT